MKSAITLAATFILTGCGTVEINRTADITKCDYKTGFENKSAGLAYPGGCSSNLEKQYLTGHRTARKLSIIEIQEFELLNEVRLIDSESETQRKELIGSQAGPGIFEHFDFADKESRAAWKLKVLSGAIDIAWAIFVTPGKIEEFNRQEELRIERKSLIATELDRLGEKRKALLEFHDKMLEDPSKIETHIAAYYSKSADDPIDIDKPLGTYLESRKTNNKNDQQKFFGSYHSPWINTRALVITEIPHLKYDYTPLWGSSLLGFGVGHALKSKESYLRSGWKYTAADSAFVSLAVALNSGLPVLGLVVSRILQIYHVYDFDQVLDSRNSEILTQSKTSLPFFISSF